MDTWIYFLLTLQVLCFTVVSGTNCTYEGVTYESHKTYIHPGVHQKCNLCTCSPTLNSHFSCTDFDCQLQQDNKCRFIRDMEIGEQRSFFTGCLQCTCTETGVSCTINKLKCDVQLELECEYEGGEHKYSAWMTWPMNDNCIEYCTCLGAGIPACSIEATCSAPAECGPGHNAKESWNKTECGYCYCPLGGKAACGRRACETTQFAYSTQVGAGTAAGSSLLLILTAIGAAHVVFAISDI